MNREIFLHVGLKGLRQSGMLLLLAVVVALIGNQVRPQGLALVDEEWSLEAHIKAPDGSGMTVTLDEAKEFFFSGSAVFIDARSEDLIGSGISSVPAAFPGNKSRALSMRRPVIWLPIRCSSPIAMVKAVGSAGNWHWN